ncbi:hypothetical protein B0H66DRAFT_110264 [Apodospora peruviana]|uniref:Ankyrin repeat protein n=1 Tax=Apodospora peruviana TaxID=516989 RepID=A0AAE0MBM3_9PEZI|nr:hypothetical protein B0H66DRAFT_110264 [Apodospora peruviana]
MDYQTSHQSGELLSFTRFRTLITVFQRKFDVSVTDVLRYSAELDHVPTGAENEVLVLLDLSSPMFLQGPGVLNVALLLNGNGILCEEPCLVTAGLFRHDRQEEDGKEVYFRAVTSTFELQSAARGTVSFLLMDIIQTRSVLCSWQFFSAPPVKKGKSSSTCWRLRAASSTFGNSTSPFASKCCRERQRDYCAGVVGSTTQAEDGETEYLDAQDCEGVTVILRAAKRGMLANNTAVLSMLVQEGVRNHGPHSNWSNELLHLASANGWYALVKVLLIEKCVVVDTQMLDVRTNDLVTPLFVAARNGDPLVVDLL